MQTLGTGAAKLNLAFQIGSARDITFSFVNSDGTDTDISLWTFELFFKRFAGDRLSTFSLTLGDGLSFPVYQDNEVLAEITTTDTSIEEGEYFWELRRTDENVPLVNGSAFFTYEGETGDTSTVTVTSGSQTINVIIYGAFGGGSWGSITGTLSDQTDLQSALDAKQATLVSGTNIKTINSTSILGSGNINISGAGDVVGPASATDSNFAAFDTTTGKLIKDSGSSASSFDAAGAAATVQSNLNTHEADTSNPHSVTAAQTGADPSGSAAAVQTNLDAHEADTSNPHSVTATQVGLGNVDNTSDADKPVSTATQTALNLKANLISPSFTTPNLGTPSAAVLTNATGLPTTGLVDDAVTLAKMASGTAGNLITYDASGNPAAVATGTATHVLTSNGPGLPPTFQAASGGGSSSHALLGKINVNSAVTGTTAETIAGSFLVASSSVEANDILRFYVLVNKSASVGNTTVKVYVNETNDLTTPTLLATLINTSGNVYGSLNRRIFMKNSVSSFDIIDDTTALTPDDAIQGTQAVDNLSFDLSAAFYFIVTITPSNASDTLTLRGVTLERMR